MFRIVVIIACTKGTPPPSPLVGGAKQNSDRKGFRDPRKEGSTKGRTIRRPS